MDLKKLIEIWTNRAINSFEQSDDATNSYTSERLYSEATTLTTCISELNGALQSTDQPD